MTYIIFRRFRHSRISLHSLHYRCIHHGKRGDEHGPVDILDRGTAIQMPQHSFVYEHVHCSFLVRGLSQLGLLRS